jgi:methylenetetrahydrofolate dehydrogenase (NADP+) / methenyltetrahydrofolate cyclohydrolase
MATLLEGGKVAAAIKESLKADIAGLIEKGVQPKLKVILVGNNGASMSYVRMVERSFSKENLLAEVVRLDDTISEAELLGVLEGINNDSMTHGILVQLPLPKHIDEDKVIRAMNTDKDLDGFHPLNVGKLVIGDDTYYPCTPYGIIKMIDHYGIDCTGKNTVVIGRSNIVGKPISMLMLAKNATVTICHSRTKDLASITKEADILIAAIGKCQFVTKEMVKEGAVVIDVGIHDVDGKIMGDVDFDGVKDIAGAITPVPGGVGSTTIATLMENLVKAAKLQTQK